MTSDSIPNTKRTYYISGAVDRALELNKPPVPFDGYFKNFIKFEIEGMASKDCDDKAISYAKELCEKAKRKYTATAETDKYPDKYMPDYITSLYFFGEDKSIWIVGHGKLEFIKIGFTDKSPEKFLALGPTTVGRLPIIYSFALSLLILIGLLWIFDVPLSELPKLVMIVAFAPFNAVIEIIQLLKQ